MNNLPVKNQIVTLSSLPKQIQASTILEIITRAINMTGTRAQQEDVEFIVSELTGLINSRYSNLTIDEIEDTICKGALGDFHESYLTVRNINIWLKEYQAEKTRKKMILDKNVEREQQMPMVEKSSFLLKNIDKLPSLRRLLDRT